MNTRATFNLSLATDTHDLLLQIYPTPQYIDINYSQVMNIFSGLSLARVISSLDLSVGDGGRGEKTPIFGVCVALVPPL